MSWKNEEMSVRQKWVIEKLGGVAPTNYTKYEASRLIDKLNHQTRDETRRMYSGEQEDDSSPWWNDTFGGMD